LTVVSRLRVLIADDNARVVKSVSRLLGLDYDVVGTVAIGSGLLQAAQDLHPDIIVLDLSLRDGDSLEACRQVTRRLPDTKVIVFSADHDPEVTARAYEAGASDVVDKLLADALISAVRRLDGNR
jgi:DNA-binding NarL/FixJ family response regulator